MSIPIIQKNQKKEQEKRFKSLSEAVHNALIASEANALEAELVLSQMAQIYATAAKKAYKIKQKENV